MNFNNINNELKFNWLEETNNELNNILNLPSNNGLFITYIDAYLQTIIIILNNIGNFTKDDAIDRLNWLKQFETRYNNNINYLVRNNKPNNKQQEQEIIKTLKQRSKKIINILY